MIDIILALVFTVSALISSDIRVYAQDDFYDVSETTAKNQQKDRSCTPLHECTYYRDLLGESVVGLSKESIQREIQKYKCDLDEDETDYDYGNEEEFSLLTNPLADCSCTNYINKYGFGNCTVLDLKPHKFHGKKVCYVDPPSNCPDLRGSVTNKGKQLSAMACKVNEEREVKDPSKVPTYLSVMCPQDNFELEVRKLIGKDLVGTRIVTGAISGKASCIGSLKIVHGNEEELGNFQELFLESDSGFKKDGGYYNIRRRFPILRTNVIIQLITQGSCCWEIYEKRKFKGEKQYLHQGEHFPDIQPASIRRVKCRY